MSDIDAAGFASVTHCLAPAAIHDRKAHAPPAADGYLGLKPTSFVAFGRERRTRKVIAAGIAVQ